MRAHCVLLTQTVPKDDTRLRGLGNMHTGLHRRIMRGQCYEFQRQINYLTIGTRLHSAVTGWSLFPLSIKSAGWKGALKTAL